MRTLSNWIELACWACQTFGWIPARTLLGSADTLLLRSWWGWRGTKSFCYDQLLCGDRRADQDTHRRDSKRSLLGSVVCSWGIAPIRFLLTKGSLSSLAVASSWITDREVQHELVPIAVPTSFCSDRFIDGWAGRILDRCFVSVRYCFISFTLGSPLARSSSYRCSNWSDWCVLSWIIYLKEWTYTSPTSNAANTAKSTSLRPSRPFSSRIIVHGRLWKQPRLTSKIR